MIIQVVGSGCTSCKKLFELTQKVVEELHIEETVEYISGEQGVQKILELGLMSSPALVVNGKVVLQGLTADAEKLKRLITLQQ